MKAEEKKTCVGVGVIGCGKISQVRHIPEYNSNTDVRIVGFFDYVQERAEEMAQKYGGVAFATLDELLECDEIDAVSVCTSNATHKVVTLSALRHGKHVLCEKPMATTLAECEEMAELSQKTKKLLMIAHNQRYMGIHKRAKELLDSNAIGRPLTFRTSFGHSGPENWSVDAGTSSWFFDKNKSAFGVMADLGIHKLDLMNYLLGSRITEIEAMLDTLDKRDAEGKFVGVEDNAVAICRMENGVIGTVTVSWTYYGGYDNDTVIYGTDGILRMSEVDNSVTLTGKDKKATTEILERQASSGVIDAFIHAITTGQDVDVSADEVIPAMRAVFAAVESTEKGKLIKI